MTTPVNFLAQGTNWKDGSNNNPPSIWSPGAGNYHWLYNVESGSGTYTLTNVAQPAAGAVVAFSCWNQWPMTGIQVTINGTQVFNDQASTDSANPTTFTSAALAPTDVVVITLTSPGGGYSTDMVFQPLDLGTAGGTVAAFSVSGNSLAIAVQDQSSAASGASITGWSWDFGDGTSPVTTQNATHAYAEPGAYSITLTVTDSAGGTDTLVRNVIVAAPILPGSDTYSVKGFMAYGSMANNVPEQVATLGELSVRSATYSKDRALYATTAGTGGNATAVNLSVFSSKTADGTTVDVPTDYATQLLTMGAWIYTQSVSGQFTSDPVSCQQQIVAEFSGVIKDVTIGQMLQQGSQWMPEYVVFHFVATSATSPSFTSISRAKLWFSDNSFASEYDEYTLEFVPPLPSGRSLDDFFKPSSQVVAEVAQFTLPLLMQQIQVVASNDPYTLVKSIEFDYHDPNDPTFTSPTNWTFVIYGAAGDNIDALKSGLVDYILSNSAHSRDDWAKIFPDIFTSTEFIICPMWNQYAVPNKTLEEGVYSPSVNLVSAQNIAPSVFIGSKYTAPHVTANTDLTGVPYKSLSLMICGGPDNRNGISRFDQQFGDYMAVPTSSLDFDRMQQSTQDFITTVLYPLLQIAENMTEFSDIPIGFTRLSRQNPSGATVLYVVATYNNVQYLVVAKSYLMAAFPPPAALSITTPSTTQITGPQNGGAMSTNFGATGGVGSYQWQIVSIDSRITNGAINPLTGAFTCTLPSWGNYPVSIKVMDGLGNSYTGNFTLVSVGT